MLWRVPLLALVSGKRELRGAGEGGSSGGDADDTEVEWMHCCCNAGFRYDYALEQCVACDEAADGVLEAAEADAEAIEAYKNGGGRHLLFWKDSYAAKAAQESRGAQCPDNVPVPWSTTWLTCGADAHACKWPEYCCCAAGYEWDAAASGWQGACVPSAEPGPAGGVAIFASQGWFASCAATDEHLYPCYMPYAHSGARQEEYCCCYPGHAYDAEAGECRPDASGAKRLGDLIPESKHWWSCSKGGFWQSSERGQYTCARLDAPVATASERYFWAVVVFGALGGGVLVRFLCAIFGNGGRSVAATGESVHRQRAKRCLAQGHQLRRKFCWQMLDSSYRTGWVCDHCDMRFGTNEPFHHCDRCNVDFCSACVEKQAPLPKVQPRTVEHVAGAEAGLQPLFPVGTRVLCRWKHGAWKRGTVLSSDPLTVKPDGWKEAHRWDEVRPVPARPDDEANPWMQSDKTAPAGHGASTAEAFGEWQSDKTAPEGDGASTAEAFGEWQSDNTAPEGDGASTGCNSTTGFANFDAAPQRPVAPDTTWAPAVVEGAALADFPANVTDTVGVQTAPSASADASCAEEPPTAE